MCPDRVGAPDRAYSSAQTTCWVRVALRLPYPVSPQESPIHPAFPRIRSQRPPIKSPIDMRTKPAPNFRPKLLIRRALEPKVHRPLLSTPAPTTPT